MPELDRREFIAAAVSACALCAFGGGLLAAEDKKIEPVEVGSLADFPKDGIYDKDSRKNGFFIIRNGGKLYATSIVCTHKGVPINVKGDELVCPKHNSHFSIEGTVTHGPAKDTLPRYAISADSKGKVIVDRNTEFHEKDFDDKASFVPTDKL